ncbi:hypothetical protein ACZ91_60240 [Streptomyces regensis]|nr:hypothetical protein ACZ91_60240 [Streptomyces regensis]
MAGVGERAADPGRLRGHTDGNGDGPRTRPEFAFVAQAYDDSGHVGVGRDPGGGGDDWGRG